MQCVNMYGDGETLPNTLHPITIHFMRYMKIMTMSALFVARKKPILNYWQRRSTFLEARTILGTIGMRAVFTISNTISAVVYVGIPWLPEMIRLNALAIPV